MSVVVSASNTNYAMTDSVMEPVGTVSSSFTLQGHAGGITAVDYARDGNRFLTGGEDGFVFLWNRSDEGIVNEVALGYNKEAVSCAEYTWNNDQILSSNRGGSALLWDIEQECVVKTMLFREDPTAVASSKRGDSIAVTSEDGSCYLFDVRLKAPVGVLETKYPQLAVRMAALGDRVFTAGLDETVRCWDLRKSSVPIVDQACKGTVTGLTLSADETLLLTNSTDCVVRSFDVRPNVPPESNRRLGVYAGARHDTSQSLVRVAISPDGERIAAGSVDGSVCVWNTESFDMKKYPAHQAAVLDVCFHPTENTLLSGAMDGTGMWLQLE